MSVPCLNETDTVVLEIGGVNGGLQAHAKAAANKGLVVTPGTGAASGLGISGIQSTGLYADVNGQVVNRHTLWAAGSGWSRGGSSFVGSGALIGAGGYVQIGAAINLNFQTHGAAAQWLEFTYHAEMAMVQSNPAASTDYDGWSVYLETSLDGAAWQEMVSETCGGPHNGFLHALHTTDQVLLADYTTHNMQLRMTVRGGFLGTAVCQGYNRFWMTARGH